MPLECDVPNHGAVWASLFPLFVQAENDNIGIPITSVRFFERFK